MTAISSETIRVGSVGWDTRIEPGHFYGEGPTDLGPLELTEWEEFLHYLYLPVRLPLTDGGTLEQDDVTLPARLEFLRGAAYAALNDAIATAPHLADPYVYITARRGYATPGAPLNRPGWHCDDFGGTDLNYIWTDVYPTRVLRAYAPLTIPTDDLDSMRVMAELAAAAFDLAEDQRHRDEVFGLRPALPPFPTPGHGVNPTWTDDAPVGHLLRLSPYVIHNTPDVPAPGGMRSFFKISVSTHRYDLIGNSHNYELDYHWPMHDRAEPRNQPATAAAIG